MSNKQSVALVTGAIALAAAGGITYALVQPSAPPPNAPVSPVSVETVNPTTSSTEAPTKFGAPSQPALPKESPRPSTSQKQAAIRQIESCKVTMARVNDPSSPLNVRSAPTTEGSDVVGSLENGTFMTVDSEKDGWLKISGPMQGWVAGNRTDKGCNEKQERVRFGTGQTSIEIGDRFIGSGVHRYQFAASKGQQLSLTRSDGPFPTLYAPDGKPLVIGVEDENRTQWSGVLPATGNYTVELDSNYRGYDYRFQVEIQ